MSPTCPTTCQSPATFSERPERPELNAITTYFALQLKYFATELRSKCFIGPCFRSSVFYGIACSRCVLPRFERCGLDIEYCRNQTNAQRFTELQSCERKHPAGNSTHRLI